MNPPSTVPAEAEIYCTLRELLDPEIGLNVIDLGLIGNVVVAPTGEVMVEITPTTPGCPMHDVLSEGVVRLVGALSGVTRVDVQFVYDPPWTPERIAPEARAQLGMG